LAIRIGRRRQVFYFLNFQNSSTPALEASERQRIIQKAKSLFSMGIGTFMENALTTRVGAMREYDLLSIIWGRNQEYLLTFAFTGNEASLLQGIIKNHEPLFSRS